MITKGNMLRSFIKFSQLILSRNDNNISQKLILLTDRTESEAHHFLYIFLQNMIGTTLGTERLNTEILFSIKWSHEVTPLNTDILFKRIQGGVD